MPRVVIAGAGICGLGTALLLARDGHEVTVLERDDHPAPDSPQDAWDSWKRKGIGQFYQPHNLMPGLRAILAAELPDVLEGLPRAGAGRFDLLNPMPASITDRSPRPIDDRLWTWTARRPVAEWVVADAAGREPRVTIRRGVRVEGLLVGKSKRDGVPHVTGVRIGDAEELRADLVIDATGRGSRSTAWLAAIGARRPYEEQADCGFTYHTRFFHGTERERVGPLLMHLETISVLTIPGDNDTWSVTIFTAANDRELANLRQVDRWSAVVRSCPLQAHWLDGEPITDVLTMSGVVDRYRRFVIDGEPVVTGLIPVADAWACTNPSAGRGVTVGFLHALRLREALREAPEDPLALVRCFDELTERHVTPWYRAQIAWDRFRHARIEAARKGRELPPPPDELTRSLAAFFAVMATDADLFRLGLEYVTTLTPVQEILRRDGVAALIAEAMETVRDRPPPTMPGPDRSRLLELVG